MAEAEELVNEAKGVKAKSQDWTKKIRENPWIISTAVFGVIAVVLLIMSSGGITGNVISETSAQEKIIPYLNSLTGGGVTFVDSKDIGNLYQVDVTYQGNTIPVYITKDGQYFVSSISQITGNAVTNTQTQQTEIPKTDKPKIDLYVMSFCPYGNKAEDTMLPVYNLLKNQVNFNVHYIVSVSGTSIQSLHGQKEVDEDEREACVLKNDGMDKWWTFTTYVNANCGSDGSCWQDAAKKAGVDASKITSCVSSDGLTLMNENAQATDAAGASGSPTLIINGVESSAVYQYGNSEAYKQAICSAFTTAPSVCSQAVGSATNTSTGGSC